MKDDVKLLRQVICIRSLENFPINKNLDKFKVLQVSQDVFRNIFEIWVYKL